jgi:ribosomal protein S18 acetylase RimI-like enzyme
VAVRYRTFRNPDPPALVRLWNASMSSRGTAFLQGVMPFEAYVLSKRYFDREGLFLAEENGSVIGCAHAGFGADESGQGLDTAQGVICMIMVMPQHRRRRIGHELLRMAEDYLRRCGAQTIVAGCRQPLAPFYWGLYGGSELSGFLRSDSHADLFFMTQGYTVQDTLLVFQRSLETPPAISDPRFAKTKRKYEAYVKPTPIVPHVCEEARHGPLEGLQFQLQEMATGKQVAQAKMWDMDLYAWRWHQAAAGLYDIEVQSGLRRQGLAKYLFAHMLRYLHDQFYTLVETHAQANNPAAVQLLQSLGFKQVDEGRVYVKG